MSKTWFSLIPDTRNTRWFWKLIGYGSGIEKYFGFGSGIGYLLVPDAMTRKDYIESASVLANWRQRLSACCDLSSLEAWPGRIQQYTIRQYDNTTIRQYDNTQYTIQQYNNTLTNENWHFWNVMHTMRQYDRMQLKLYLLFVFYSCVIDIQYRGRCYLCFYILEDTEVLIVPI